MREDYVSLRDDEEKSGSRPPPFVGREHESCGRSLEKLSQLYSQAPYTFQLLSDRAAFQFCTQTNLIVCRLVLQVFLFPVPLRDLADD